jgi:hypothetical protein
MKEQIYSYPHGATKLVNLPIVECAAVGERKKEKGKQFIKNEQRIF